MKNIKHSKVTFDSLSTIKITKKQNRDILEFILAEFDVYITIPALHAYLLAKKFSGFNVDKELNELKKILKIIPISEEVIKKAVEIDSALVKEGVLMKFEDLILVASSIVTGALLVVDDKTDKYKPLRKYGLEYTSLGAFLEKINALAKDEAEKEKITI